MPKATLVTIRDSTFPFRNIRAWKVGSDLVVPIRGHGIFPAGSISITNGKYRGKQLDLRTGDIF